MKYKNFDIFIEEKTAKGDYLLKAQAEGYGEARGSLSLDLSDPTLKKTLVSLSDRQLDKEAQIHFGLILYKKIFNGEIERVFYEYNGNVLKSNKIGIRIRLRIYPPEIASLPWELLYSPVTKQFLASSENYPLVRYIELPQRIKELESTFPVNILVVIPEYSAPYFSLDTSHEKESLLDSLKGLENNVSIFFIEGKVTRTKIIHELSKKIFHCFHFIGHGDFNANKGTLLLNDKKGGTDPINDDDFASLFQNHPSMKLVVLNSCKGAEVSTIQPMVGMAPTLVQKGIPAVIAMQYAIYDEAAVDFAQAFYQKLFKSNDSGRVDIAISHARYILGNNPPTQNDMCTPVLFMRSATGVLFDLPAGLRIIDVPINERSMDTVESTANQYSINQLIEPNLSDRKRLNDLRKKIKYARYAINSFIIAVIVVFSLLWVKAFDALTLDTKSEALIMGVGDKIFSKPINKNLALIGFTVDHDKDTWKETWRKQHASLIEKLARAGASVIVFDIKFTSKTSDETDSRLVNAINKAKQAHKATIILGYEDIKNNDFSRPVLNDSILSSSAITGFTYAGKRIGLSRSIVLAVEKELDNKDSENHGDNSDNKKKKITKYSVVVEAYAAFKHEKIGQIDANNMQIMLENSQHNIGISEYKKVRSHQKGAIQKDDFVIQNYIDFLPINTLRGKEYSHSYVAVLNNYDQEALEQAFKGKIVVVGEKNASDTFSILSLFSTDHYGYELLAEALNSLLEQRTIKANNVFVALFLMVLSGALGALLRYYIYFHNITSRTTLLMMISAVYCVVTVYIYIELLILIKVIYHLSALFFSYWITGKLMINKRQ